MNFITGKLISRRRVLRGAGAALALPFMDAMSPAGLWSKSPAREVAKPAHRFLAYYLPNGQAMPHWTPKGSRNSRRKKTFFGSEIHFS